jgi:hypothetical protein
VCFLSIDLSFAIGAALAAVSYRIAAAAKRNGPDSVGRGYLDHAFCNKILPTFRPTADRFAELGQFASPACYDYGARRIFCPGHEAPFEGLCMVELLLGLP